jgi:thymidylate synthase-like protein
MPEIKTPKVTLVSHTNLPLETVFAVWEQSKLTTPYRSPERIKAEVDPAEVRKLFHDVIEQRIPVGEHIDFIFELEHISISWREQAVRHRIGTKPGPEGVGADFIFDIIPDLADSSWWSQSMRLLDLRKFAARGDYRVPESILAHPEREALYNIYKHVMDQIELGYTILADAGIPLEDARELIPLGAQHRMTWKLNMGALQHIASKRSCWILQMPIWGPILRGMVSELVTKIDPAFGMIVTPPCMKGDSFMGCKFEEENARRYDGRDAHPVCSLHFFNNHMNGARTVGHPAQVRAAAAAKRLPMVGDMMSRAKVYRNFWGRDPFSGIRLSVEQLSEANDPNDEYYKDP